MGTKDNSQKSNRILHSLFALTLATGAFAAIHVTTKIDKMESIIVEQQKKIEEQDSLTNQQEQEINKLKDENLQLKDTLEQQKGQYIETIKQKDIEIEGLEGQVAAKREAEARKERLRLAKTNTSVVPSRGDSKVSKEIYMEATGYTAFCSEGCTGVTATGINLANNRNAKVVAVDPNVIPLGTKVWVEGYGYAIAGDTGGGIDGYELDLHFATNGQAIDWGRRTVRVKILEG